MTVLSNLCFAHFEQETVQNESLIFLCVGRGFRIWRQHHHPALLGLIRECPQACCTLPFMRQSLTWRSSAPETTRGSVGWKDAQLTPRSWPSRTYFTTASPLPKRSLFICVRRIKSSDGATPFFFNALMSQTRTVWSRDAETTKSSFRWKDAHIT